MIIGGQTIMTKLEDIAQEFYDEFRLKLRLDLDEDNQFFYVLYNHKGEAEFGVWATDIEDVIEELKFFLDYKRGKVMFDEN